MWRYVVAAIPARLADEGARVGLVLLAVERADSPTLGGLFVAALLVPQVVAAPVVGRALDRAPRPAPTLAALTAGFSVCLGLAATLLGRTSAVLVLLVLVGAGVMAPAVTGGLTSQLSSLVGPSRLGRAYGVDSLVYTVCGVAGPAVVGVLASAWSGGLAMYALAGAGLVGAVAMSGLRTPARRSPPADGPAARRWAAIAAIVRDRELAAVTTASCVGQVGLGALGVVAIVVASRQGAAPVAGLVLAALAVGALLGSLLWTWRPAPPPRAAWVAVLGQVCVGAPLGLGAAVPGLVGLAVVLAVAGLAVGPVTGAVFLTRERRSPPDTTAQVFALGAGLKLACGAVGATLAGLVSDLDSWLLLFCCGAFPVMAGVAGASMLVRRRRRERVVG